MSKPQDAQQSVLMVMEPGAAGPGQAKAPVDKTLRRYDQDQPMLLAPDLRDWLAADHPARFGGWVSSSHLARLSSGGFQRTTQHRKVLEVVMGSA